MLISKLFINYFSFKSIGFIIISIFIIHTIYCLFTLSTKIHDSAIFAEYSTEPKNSLYYQAVSSYSLQDREEGWIADFPYLNIRLTPSNRSNLLFI